MYQQYTPKYLRLIALSLAGAVLPLFFYLPEQTLAQVPINLATTCAKITAPLTSEEKAYASTAWQYFVNNYQSETGFTNSVGGYPSGTLWDMGNYLMALNTARQLNLIDQGEFDSRLNLFLTSLMGLRQISSPNKAQSSFVSKEYVPIVVQPLHKTERHRCPKRL
ncbi:DUF3131 domain-containing protein [Lyngbya aestuarii]|uniref:DUF3131 domain-containing protein n=1 Tax=Lyngbya aestuarii TaxID=118322 RepID=UPI00403D7B7E